MAKIFVERQRLQGFSSDKQIVCLRPLRVKIGLVLHRRLCRWRCLGRGVRRRKRRRGRPPNRSGISSPASETIVEHFVHSSPCLRKSKSSPRHSQPLLQVSTAFTRTKVG